MPGGVVTADAAIQLMRRGDTLSLCCLFWNVGLLDLRRFRGGYSLQPIVGLVAVPYIDYQDNKLLVLNRDEEPAITDAALPIGVAFTASDSPMLRGLSGFATRSDRCFRMRRAVQLLCAR